MAQIGHKKYGMMFKFFKKKKKLLPNVVISSYGYDSLFAIPQN